MLILAHTLALASQNGLVNGERVALDRDQAAVGGDAITDSDGYDVTGDEEVGLDARYLAIVADNAGERRRVFLERGNGLLGTALLRNTDNSVEDEDCEDLEARQNNMC